MATRDCMGRNLNDSLSEVLDEIFVGGRLKGRVVPPRPLLPCLLLVDLPGHDPEDPLAELVKVDGVLSQGPYDLQDLIHLAILYVRPGKNTAPHKRLTRSVFDNTAAWFLCL